MLFERQVAYAAKSLQPSGHGIGRDAAAHNWTFEMSAYAVPTDATLREVITASRRPFSHRPCFRDGAWVVPGGVPVGSDEPTARPSFIEWDIHQRLRTLLGKQPRSIDPAIPLVVDTGTPHRAVSLR